MEPGVVTVFVKTDRDVKKPPPGIGEIVRQHGRRGLFEVVRIDEERGTADLMQRAGLGEVEHNVPFTQIYAISPHTAQAIHEFLVS